MTLIDPPSVTLAFDTDLAVTSSSSPMSSSGRVSAVGEGSLIRSFSYLEGARMGENTSIGPFARLRPGAELGREVHIGNFVEVKASEVGAGAKINHLSYIGTPASAPRRNIGAGTVTCNYDGFGKYRTEIGARAFIGSHSVLVAPVKIGDGAYIGAGSVITQDVALMRWRWLARAQSKRPAGRGLSGKRTRSERGVSFRKHPERQKRSECSVLSQNER